MAVWFFLTLLIILINALSINAKTEVNSDIQISLEPYQRNVVALQHQIELNDNYWHTVDTVQSLIVLRNKVQKIINQDNENLQVTHKLLKIMSIKSKNLENVAFYNIMKKKEHDIAEHIASANIIIYKINVLQNIAVRYEVNNNFYNVLTKTNPLWQTIDSSLINPTLTQISQYTQQTLNQIVFHSLFYSISLAFALALIFRGAVLWLKHRKKEGIINPIIKRYAPFIFFLIGLDGYLYFLSNQTTGIEYIIWGINSILIYLLFMMATQFDLSLNNCSHLRGKFIRYHTVVLIIVLAIYNWLVLLLSFIIQNIPLKFTDYRIETYVLTGSLLIIYFITRDRSSPNEPVAISFIKRIQVVASLAFVGSLSLMLLNERSLPLPLLGLYNTLLIIGFNTALLWLSWLIFRLKYFKHRYYVSLAAKVCLGLFFFFIIKAAWLGYHHFSSLFIVNCITTFMVLIILKNVNVEINNIYLAIINPHQKISKKLFHVLGMQHGGKIFEFVIFRYLIMTIPFFIAIIALLQLWGVILYDTVEFYKVLKTGVLIDNIYIYPTRIIRSGILFCIIMLLGRYWATNITNTPRFNADKSLQIMIQALIRYLIFIVALVFALFVAGFNLAHLIVATGGLAIGIGFGFKQIASDAGCGLYIMIDMPFRIGDYISVEDTDGVVKKIDLLTTQILTNDHSIANLPNSFLLRHLVVNYTYATNKMHRMSIIVFIKNNKQIEESRTLLLQVAAKNPHVIQEKPYQPAVLLQGNHLTLECDIENITMKKLVLNELITSINEAFGAKGFEYKYWSKIKPSAEY